jgi:hypothetical protein
MNRKLTATTIKDLKPEPRPYEVRDTEIKGFLLRISPAGRMTYYLDYRNALGKRNRHSIGITSKVTPAQARDIAGKLAGDVAHGIDLQARKKIAKQEAEHAKAQTLGNFIDQKYKPWVLAERKSGSETLKRLEHNFADLKTTPMAGIDAWTVGKWQTAQFQTLQWRQDAEGEVSVRRRGAAAQSRL